MTGRAWFVIVVLTRAIVAPITYTVRAVIGAMVHAETVRGTAQLVQATTILNGR